MSVDAAPHPSLAHRLFEPVPQDVMRRYLESRPPTPELPATFRGPNWKKDV
ncbi:hypothetical protein ACFWZS_21685 [[Kitasatospora] papulosa]|uniref:hypothetical protein n=1 Tax=[Kitasatospora] papulosa TaxID=1464011 RepID=UPI0036AF161C